MRLSSSLVAALAGIALTACVPVGAARQRKDVRYEKIHLLHADARHVALMFGAKPEVSFERGPRIPPRRTPISRPPI